MIKIANINKLPLNTIYINSCVHFGFQLIPLTAVLYSHIDKTLFIVKKKCQSDPHGVMIL